MLYFNSKSEYVGLLQDARDKEKENLLNIFLSSVYTKENSGADIQKKDGNKVYLNKRWKM